MLLPALKTLATSSALMLLAILLASCVTTGSSVPVTKVACGSFQPITWSGKDTPATVLQVKEHNAAGKAICGWGKK